jgi:hypothetical protein
MKALKLIYESSFEPQVLEMLGDVFDEVWCEISHQYDPDDDQRARLQLARIILAEYRDGMGAPRLKEAVVPKMRSALIVSQMLRTA